MLHPLEVLPHHEQPGIRQQVMDVGHPARQAVLAGKHREIRSEVLHRCDRVLEGLAGQRFHPWIRPAARQVGIGAGQALERDGSGYRHRTQSDSAVERGGDMTLGFTEL